MIGRRVYIRGVGVVSSLGKDWPSTVLALARGRSAIAPIRHFDVEGLPSTVGAAVTEVAAEAADRRVVLARLAAAEAWAHAGARAEPERLGLFIGAEPGRATLASVLAGEWGARGPAQTVSLAGASGSAAIIEAVRALRLGICDVAVCGGVGADVDPLVLSHLGRLGLLSARGLSCPFDVRRDGFVVGEGAAMLVLSVERGEAMAEVAGVGRALEADDLTDTEPEGEGARRAMSVALRDARTEAVDCVQSQAASTFLQDRMEARALHAVLGAGLGRARVSSVKGALGHWGAGAGALGVVCAWDAVAHGRVLPTAGLEQPDPDCDLPLVMGEALPWKVEAALVNAFAFGGAKTSLVLRRCT